MNDDDIGFKILFTHVVVIEGSYGHDVVGVGEDGLGAQKIHLDIYLDFASVLAFLHETDCINNWIPLVKNVHAGQASHGNGKCRQIGPDMHGHVWVVGISKSRKTEASQAFHLNRIQSFALEDQVAEFAGLLNVLQGIQSLHFLLEILICIEKPFEILALELERESLMLTYGPVLDLVELIKLSFEHIEVAALFGVQIDVTLLILL